MLVLNYDDCFQGSAWTPIGWWVIFLDLDACLQVGLPELPPRQKPVYQLIVK